jgi:enolase
MAEVTKETQNFKPKPHNCGKKASSRSKGLRKMYLERGWVIANHKLVSFHAAFISSVLSLPTKDLSDLVAAGGNVKRGVLEFMFWPLHSEVWISLVILYLSWHIGIAIHEMGHFLTAMKLTALNKDSQEKADAIIQGEGGKFGWYAKMFLLIPWGKFYGVKKENGNFAPDAPYNLAVAASAPIWSQWLATIFLPIAIICIALGLTTGVEIFTYIGRFFLAPGCVGMLDRLLADPGKLREYRTREKIAAEQAARAAAAASKESWTVQVGQVKQRLLTSRIQTVTLKDGSKVATPWQFRNCAMGGRHTEKEYPESNISMQESMFMPLSPKTYEDAQEMTVRLQYRLKEIMEAAPGAKVMGVGLEGGIAPYVDKEPQDLVPEQRMWRMMKQAILDCEYVPGVDVAIALDPACSELENAYRTERGEPDSIGMYRFWRDKSKVEMSRDQILDLYKQALEEDIPVLSIEDGFGERDHEGWQNLMKELGDKVFVIGDDLVTTKDTNIESCAKNGEINASLIKANQIGTLTETILAMLTSLAYGAELVVSHRSKSPNDPFEAEIGTAMNALGVKCGGGANTERLQKYGRVMEIIALAKASQRETTEAERKELEENVKELVRILTGKEGVSIMPDAAELDIAALMMKMLAVEAVSGTEEATNAGIPSAAATLFLGKTGIVRFKGSTPLGTSAGEDEAIHYVDSIIEPSETVKKYPDLFRDAGDGTFRFKKDVKADAVKAKNDEKLTELWRKSRRYEGMGCMDAVKHIESVLAKAFIGRKLADLGSVLQIDQQLLGLELEQAVLAKRISKDAPKDEKIHAMQRKGIIGMNAILSMSLALGRAVAASEGRELWQLLRDIASDTMAKFVEANAKDNKKKLADLKTMDFDELQKLYRSTSEQAIKDGKAIYELLRAQLPVYPV